MKCALDLCTVIKSYDVPGIAGSIPCPLCRSGIASFRRRADEPEPEPELSPACSGGSHGRNCSGAGDHQASSSPEKKRAVDPGQLDVLPPPLYSAPLTLRAVLS